MSTLLFASIQEAIDQDIGFNKAKGFVSVIQHCDELQDIYRPLAVYHEDEYKTVPAINAALKQFFGDAYRDNARDDWRMVLTIEL